MGRDKGERRQKKQEDLKGERCCAKGTFPKRGGAFLKKEEEQTAPAKLNRERRLPRIRRRRREAAGTRRGDVSETRGYVIA